MHHLVKIQYPLFVSVIHLNRALGLNSYGPAEVKHE